MIFLRKILFAASAVLLCVGIAHSYVKSVSAGSSSDPLISLSYINEEFKPQISEKGDKIIADTFDSLQKRMDTKLSNVGVIGQGASDAELVAMLIKDKIATADNVGNLSHEYKSISMHAGDKIYLGLGAKFVVTGGQAALFGNDSEFINLSDGVRLEPNIAAKNNVQCIKASDGEGGIEAAVNYTSAAVCGSYQIKRAYTPQYKNMADGLFGIGLFKGTNSGYELDRSASRIEALVMLIRLLGEEDAALKCTEPNPFTDVDSWAVSYVAYAYAKGYTKGVSADKFNPSAITTADQYSTFILRALGYNDSNGDFSWDNAANFSAESGIIADDEKAVVTSGVFRRDYLVLLSCKALFANLKSEEISLLDKLISNGTVSSETAKTYENLLKNISEAM